MPEWLSRLIARVPGLGPAEAMPMSCPWCHAPASTLLLRRAGRMPAQAPLGCPNCGTSSPVSLWHLEGQIAELQAASSATVTQLESLSGEQRDKLEARLRRSHEEIERVLKRPRKPD
jgi:hypothetical protein